MQKKNAQSNGVVMRRGALPDKLASMRYYDKTWVKYSLTVPQENLRTNPDGSPELSKYGGLMVEVPVKNRQSDKLFFPPEKHLKESEMDGFVQLQGFMKYGSVNHQTFMAIDVNKLQKRCNAKQHSIEVQELYSNS